MQSALWSNGVVAPYRCSGSDAVMLLRLARIVRWIDILQTPRTICGDLDDCLLIDESIMRHLGRKCEETSRWQRGGGALLSGARPFQG